MNSLTLNAYFDRYRDMLYALGHFIVFDVGVLLLSVYIAFQLAEDALKNKAAQQSHSLAPHAAESDPVCGILDAFGRSAAILTTAEVVSR